MKKEIDAVIDGDSYWDRRDRILGLTEMIISEMNELIQTKKGSNLRLEIIPFIKLIETSMEIEDGVIDYDLVKKFMFVKPLLLGEKKNLSPVMRLTYFWISSIP